MIEERKLTIKEKALRINLDNSVYGSFAEIGAGQEVAANFFKAGGASGTIAKTMSGPIQLAIGKIVREFTGKAFLPAHFADIVYSYIPFIPGSLEDMGKSTCCIMLFKNHYLHTLFGKY